MKDIRLKLFNKSGLRDIYEEVEVRHESIYWLSSSEIYADIKLQLRNIITINE